ncbi:MAG: glycosyltransferase [Nitrospinae bacterium]|nr:glycosyltransferase [Nitrospinota bacterium]
MSAEDITVSLAEAPAALEGLVNQFCSMPVDFSDVPVLPENMDPAQADLIRRAAESAMNGDYRSAWDTLATVDDTASFEPDYARGKILFAMRLYHEAARHFQRGVIRFPGYGEMWFLYGMANYQMGLFSEAFMEWYEATRVNVNHQDALYVMNLAASMIKNSHKHLNPEAEFMLPIVSGKGIDVGCGSAKTHPDAIGVDLIPPGEKGDVASQKGRISQADVTASGDHLPMFADGELDYVIARHNLEHYGDPLAALREWRRVLKPGGLIGIVLPDDDEFDTMSADATHKTAFTKNSFAQMASHIEGLRIVSAGTCMNKWSFYAILQKVAPGMAASFDYAAALGRWLGLQVAKRGQMALDAGLEDIAAAAFKKLKELNPEAALEIDPYALRPFPFEDMDEASHADASMPHIALMDNTPRARSWRRALLDLGCKPLTVPLTGDGKVDWQVEKALREGGAKTVLMDRFNPPAARALRRLGLKVAVWDGGPAGVDDRPAKESGLDDVPVFTQIKSRGTYLPASVDKIAGQPATSVEIYALSPPSGQSAYAEMMNKWRASLMSKSAGVEDKNRVFGAIRRIGKLLAALEAGSLGALEDLHKAAAAADLSGMGINTGRIVCAVAEEGAARNLQSIAESLGEGAVKCAEVTSEGGHCPPCSIALVHVPLNYADGVYPTAILAMAQGAVVVSNRTAGMKEAFREGEEILFYDDPAQARSLIGELNSDASRAKRIAGNGMKAVAERFGLKQRLRTILDSLAVKYDEQGA